MDGKAALDRTLDSEPVSMYEVCTSCFKYHKMDCHRKKKENVCLNKITAGSSLRHHISPLGPVNKIKIMHVLI